MTPLQESRLVDNLNRIARAAEKIAASLSIPEEEISPNPVSNEDIQHVTYDAAQLGREK